MTFKKSHANDRHNVEADTDRGLGYVRDVDSLPGLLKRMSDGRQPVREAAFFSVGRILGIVPRKHADPATFYRDDYQRCLAANPDVHELVKQRSRRAPVDAERF